MTTARRAAPNERGIDYSGARPSPAGTYKAGGRFIIRYSAGAGNSNQNTAWKLCGPTEIHDAVAAGLDFIANSEWYESRITEGAGAGSQDGTADLGFWKSRGLARGASIFVSWDQDPTRSKWPAALAYLAAYNKALGGYYHVDCYAGTPFLKYALSKKVIKYGWRPNAGSWSNDGLPYQPKLTDALLDKARKATPAAIWQTGNYWWSKGADENVLLRPVGSHLAAVSAATARPAAKHLAQPYYPHPGAPAKSLISANREWGIYVTDAGEVAVHHNGKQDRNL